MNAMINVWAVVEHVRVASGAAELAIFTAVLYWFFTSSCVADMLEVVGERVGGWCGRDSAAGSLRHAVRAHRRPNHHQQDVYAKLDAEVSSRNSSLYRLKEQQTVPAPQPPVQPQVGLACARCAPMSRESWREPAAPGPEPVINVLELGRQKYANSGVVTRYLCDLAQCLNLTTYDYKDVVPDVVKDESFQRAIEETTLAELSGSAGGGGGDSAAQYPAVRRRVEARALASLRAISSAMSNRVLKAVAWVCHVALRRVSRGGCGCGAGAAALRRARDAGLPLVLVPLHRSHLDYILVTLALYLNGLRPPLVVSGDNLRIPFFGWVLRGCGAFFIRRRGDGADSGGDPLYKAALRSYILHSLAEHNNLEFFIEGGRTRTGKPQLPKAGILSVIMDAYRDGTIDDALLVPVTLNYDRLVEGSFVREQLGMPKQMETFWSALRGIWRMLNTDHGSIRIDFNQPISLKELVTSFQKYNHLSAPPERPLTPPGGNNNLAAELDRQILYNHSHSSLYGDDVSTDHKMMVEAIGRHLVYDAAQATALMATNVVSYVLLVELRGGCSLQRLHAAVEERGAHLQAGGRRLGYAGDTPVVVKHALELLGRGLVSRDGARVSARPAVPAALELGYYANTVVAHYAAPAILVTALESILAEDGWDAQAQATVQHTRLMSAALQLCAVLGKEFLLCAPCQRIEDRLLAALDTLLAGDVLRTEQSGSGLEEERWSRRFAESLDDEEGERRDPARHIKYRLSNKPEALAERRRLLLTLRPLTESYAATCRGVSGGAQRDVVKRVLDRLLEEFAQGRLRYGEAVSSDAIINCLRLLKQWGVIEMYTEQQVRKIRICEPYDNDRQAMDEVCHNIYKFNMDSPLLKQ